MSITRHWMLAIKLETLRELMDSLKEEPNLDPAKKIDSLIFDYLNELKSLEWNENIEKEFRRYDNW